MVTLIKYVPFVLHYHTIPEANSTIRLGAWLFHMVMWDQHSLKIDSMESKGTKGNKQHLSFTIQYIKWWRLRPLRFIFLANGPINVYIPGRKSVNVFKHAISVWLKRNNRIWWMALYNLWMDISFEDIIKSKIDNRKKKINNPNENVK